METERVNIITPGCKFNGTIEFENYTRFEGSLKGTLKGKPGSELILGINSVIEGKITADTIYIDGYVHGSIDAQSKVVISETGRVTGEIVTESLAIMIGGFFDGNCAMKSKISTIHHSKNVD